MRHFHGLKTYKLVLVCSLLMELTRKVGVFVLVCYGHP